MVQWTPDVVKKLTQLHGKGLPPKAIANQLGCSKNAVAGKLFRLDLVDKGKTPAMVCADKNLKALEEKMPAVKACLAGERSDRTKHIHAWISQQKFNYRQGRLSKTWTETLEAIPGWSWMRTKGRRTDSAWAKAMAQHKARYIPDQACIHGHRERYTKSGNCVECAKQSFMRFKGKRDANKVPRDKRSPVSDECHQARATGQVRYQTAHPCKQGHPERYASTGACVQCQLFKTQRRHNAMKRLATTHTAEHQIQQ